MKPPLRILHLEDDPNHVALAQAALEADGFVCARKPALILRRRLKKVVVT